MRRRALLASAAMTTAVSVGGCLGSTDDADVEPNADDRDTDPSDDEPGLKPDYQYAFPEDCPTSHELDIVWPEELDADSAASFVVTYEERYFEDVVVGEPESRLEKLVYDVGYRPPVEEVDDGFLVEISGGGAQYTPRLHLEAAVADPPKDATRVPKGAVDEDSLTELLDDAATEGKAELRIGPGSEVDHYIDTIASLSPDVDPLSEPGDSGLAFFDVDDGAVKLTLTADSFHGDMGWTARYYIDEDVLWRDATDDGSPGDGELLECRKPE